MVQDIEVFCAHFLSYIVALVGVLKHMTVLVC